MPHNKVDEKYVYLGIYQNDKSKLDSLLIKLNMSSRKIINKLLKLSGNLERLRGTSNLLFLPIDGKVSHINNEIYLRKVTYPILNLLLKKKEGSSYAPKYPTYKFIVEKNIDIHSFWSKNKVNKLNEIEVTFE